MHKSQFWVIFTILAVFSIFPMVFTGCIVIDLSPGEYTYFVVVNNHDQTIKNIHINFLDSGFSFDGYIIENVNIAPGRSKKINLEKIITPFDAEVIVWFGDKYDVNEYRFFPGETTVITLNETGILE